MRLLDRYGAAELQAAILEALRARRAASERRAPGPRAPARAARRGTAGRHRPARACAGARRAGAAARTRNLRPAQGRRPMTDARSPCAPAPSALHLHGLLAHWSEVASRRLARRRCSTGRSRNARRRSLERRLKRRPDRPLQAALRLRLDLAQALRPRRRRGADDARLPRGGRQRRPGRPERRRQVDAGAEHRPSGADRRTHRAVHQRRPAARRSLRARQRFRPAPPPAPLRPSAAAGRSTRSAISPTPTAMPT